MGERKTERNRVPKTGRRVGERPLRVYCVMDTGTDTFNVTLRPGESA